jgi:DNA-binding GntR family transcriptional regulator
LTAERALQALGNRRIVVPELTRDEVRDLRGARNALEPVVAAGAARWAMPRDIDRLQGLDARLDAAIGRGGASGCLRAKHAFHSGVNAVSRLPVHTALLESLLLRFGPPDALCAARAERGACRTATRA